MANRMGPIFPHDNARPHITQPMLQKSNKLAYKVLPHLWRLPVFSPTDYHFFKHLDNLLWGKCFQNQQDTKNAFREFVKSWSTDFNATEINLFLVGKSVLIVTIPIWLTKMFEPSHSDLQFRVWNCNYLCINLTERVQ